MSGYNFLSQDDYKTLKGSCRLYRKNTLERKRNCGCVPFNIDISEKEYRQLDRLNSTERLDLLELLVIHDALGFGLGKRYLLDEFVDTGLKIWWVNKTDHELYIQDICKDLRSLVRKKSWHSGFFHVLPREIIKINHLIFYFKMTDHEIADYLEAVYIHKVIGEVEACQ